MTDKNGSKDHKTKEPKKSLLGAFIAKEKPDKDYLPELKEQWQEMDRKERVKFVFGVILGLLIFIGMLILAYIALSALRG